MEKKMRTLKLGLMVGLISLVASPAFAKTPSLKDAGVALWIFGIIGALIIMQLIPAAILFFSFVGTATTLAFKKGKKAEEEVLLPGVEPAPVKK
jgi:membrane associated rhomboid family serine protease